MLSSTGTAATGTTTFDASVLDGCFWTERKDIAVEVVSSVVVLVMRREFTTLYSER